MDHSEHPQRKTIEAEDPNILASPDTSSSNFNDINFLFPKHTANWDSRVVDRLGVRCTEEDIFSIVNSRWCLFHLSSADHRVIERCVDACDLKLDYESLDVVAPSTVTPLKTWVSSWKPNEEQLKVIKTEELLEKFETRLDEFSYCLANIAQRKPDTRISEWKYQTLFKKVLRLFDFYTWSQPFLETEKAMIMGKTVSSKADILCCLSDPGIHKSVVCVCEIKEVCTEEGDESDFHPRKRLRQQSGDSSSTVTTSSEKCSLSPHIGELFVYLDQSVRNEGILGITVERTLVRITCLHVEKSSIEKIKSGNSAGCIKLDELRRPVFYFSKPFNFLKQADRRVLFKALLCIKLMQLRYEKGSG